MSEPTLDARGPVDPRIDSDAREGLTGTAPANLYKAHTEADQITVAPDGRPMEAQPAWRRDFPIDWPQDQYIARRDFTKFLVLTSFAFLVGQAWIFAQNLGRRALRKPPMKKIASLSALEVGETLVFSYPEDDEHCVLIRTAPDRLLAYSQECTHLACAVVPRPEKGVIHCPCHEGYFDLATGRPIAGPPRRPLPRILLEVVGDDVYATGVELRTV